jgi:hypothetical protein
MIHKVTYSLNCGHDHSKVGRYSQDKHIPLYIRPKTVRHHPAPTGPEALDIQAPPCISARQGQYVTLEQARSLPQLLHLASVPCAASPGAALSRASEGTMPQEGISWP